MVAPNAAAPRDENDMIGAAHPKQCRGCNARFYSNGAERCLRCRTADAAGQTEAAASGPERIPRIIVRTYS